MTNRMRVFTVGILIGCLIGCGSATTIEGGSPGFLWFGTEMLNDICVVAHHSEGWAFDAVYAFHIAEKPTEGFQILCFGLGLILWVAEGRAMVGGELVESVDDVAFDDQSIHCFYELIQVHDCVLEFLK